MQTHMRGVEQVRVLEGAGRTMQVQTQETLPRNWLTSSASRCARARFFRRACHPERQSDSAVSHRLHLPSHEPANVLWRFQDRRGWRQAGGRKQERKNAPS